MQPFELAPQRLAGPTWIDRNRVEDRSQDRPSQAIRLSIEVPTRLGRDVNLKGLLPAPRSYLDLSNRERWPFSAWARDRRIDRANC